MATQTLNGEPVVILLVEDDPDHAELLMRVLQEHRVANRVYHVADGEAAENYLFRRNEYADQAKSPRPHVILLDLRLPKVDGLELASEVKSSPKLRGIPVVMLTTSNAEADMLRAYEERADGHLVKPVDFVSLSRQFGSLGFCWVAWNRCPWSQQQP